MFALIGIVVIFALVFGGFISAGGKIEVIMHALPHELTMIGGAIIGAFMIGNHFYVIKQVFKDLGKCFKGPKWSKKDYADLLCLMFLIMKTIKTKGILSMESHIEKPEESSLLSGFTKITHDHFAMDLICDTIRMMTMSLEDPNQVEDSIQRLLDKHHAESLASPDALQNVADSLPAIGIVAAVLGIIKTMSSIDQPPEVLGHMIGSALVGTFLGVFLAYCFAGPMASKIKACYNQDFHYYMIIRDVFVAHLRGNPPQISIEMGRSLVPTVHQPSFATLEIQLNEIKS